MDDILCNRLWRGLKLLKTQNGSIDCPQPSALIRKRGWPESVAPRLTVWWHTGWWCVQGWNSVGCSYLRFWLARSGMVFSTIDDIYIMRGEREQKSFFFYQQVQVWWWPGDGALGHVSVTCWRPATFPAECLHIFMSLGCKCAYIHTWPVFLGSMYMFTELPCILFALLDCPAVSWCFLK